MNGRAPLRRRTLARCAAAYTGLGATAAGGARQLRILRSFALFLFNDALKGQRRDPGFHARPPLTRLLLGEVVLLSFFHQRQQSMRRHVGLGVMPLLESRPPHTAVVLADGGHGAPGLVVFVAVAPRVVMVVRVRAMRVRTPVCMRAPVVRVLAPLALLVVMAFAVFPCIVDLVRLVFFSLVLGGSCSIGILGVNAHLLLELPHGLDAAARRCLRAFHFHGFFRGLLEAQQRRAGCAILVVAAGR